jgi:hypothetical protein
MSKTSRDIKFLRQNDRDLRVQYEELLCLRAKVAGLLYPLKGSPPRKHGITRSDRSAANEQYSELSGRLRRHLSYYWCRSILLHRPLCHRAMVD